MGGEWICEEMVEGGRYDQNMFFETSDELKK